ncbi:hypothetical protein [Halopelagius fulvigenes]|uniref:Methanogenesis regulatory protein FilR1 middle domain-containing protein n=1 Tax=Halopelagius fulvigenes TaxID=1198324 RepID=A0ABD5TWK4_9EURY
MTVLDNIMNSLFETYEEPVRDSLQTDYFELYRTSELVPFSVTVAETSDSTWAVLLSHSEGSIFGALRNSSPEAVEWA